MSALLSAKGLEFRYARRSVLALETLCVERSQVVLVTGPNGAGKTTLLRIMAGLLTATGGRFTCLGTAMGPRAAARFCRGRHVYLHQTPYLFDASVADNVAYGLRVRHQDASVRRVEVREALAWAGLADLADRHAARLSAGEQQRVALTRARVLAPPLLLLDEITAHMDVASRQRTAAMIADLRASGTSVVLATHDPDLLDAPPDAAIALEDGHAAPPARRAAAVVALHRDGRGRVT